MTVTDSTATTDDDRSDDAADLESSTAGARRRADRTGVADRPRENRSPAAQRAIDRRRKRAAQRSTATIADRGRSDVSFLGRLTRSPGEVIRRVPFVVLIIGILAVGLGLTLWLSTTAAQNSYQLSEERQNNQDLNDRYDALKKQFEAGDSAPELSNAAVKLGMIPAKDVPRFVIGPDGKGRIVGEITAATGTPAPSLDAGSTRNTVAPQPGSADQSNTAQTPASVTAPGENLAGGASAPADTGPIAANVLPQSVTPAAAAPSTVARQQAQTGAAQQAR